MHGFQGFHLALQNWAVLREAIRRIRTNALQTAGAHKEASRKYIEFTCILGG
jgi:hypothetical protein